MQHEPGICVNVSATSCSRESQDMSSGSHVGASSCNTCSLLLEYPEIAHVVLFMVIRSFYLKVKVDLGAHV